MLGKLIFVVFFILFTIASILLPVQIFPGSLIEGRFNLPMEYESCVSAVVNGLVYGVVVWLVFLVIGKKITEE